MESKPRLCVGVPCYGPQEAKWWAQFAEHMSKLHQTVDLVEILVADSMATDHNRNIIVDRFLKLDCEWLFWIDADTIVPVGAVSRLIATGKTLASGLYYGKNAPHPSIAYTIYNGAYRPMSKSQRWERGEIVAVDAAGMGCMLTHRSVFEDIKASFLPYQEPGGGTILVHKDDIIGEIIPNASHKHDSKVIGGQRRTRLIPSTLENLRYPFFSLEHGRTEDLWFFELARRCGHKPWVDTSVECSHLRAKEFTGSDYRDIYGH